MIELDLMRVHRILHSKIGGYTFFANTHRIFIAINYI